MKIKSLKNIILISVVSMLSISIIPSIDVYAESNNIMNNTEKSLPKNNDQNNYFSFTNQYFFDECRKQGIDPIKILGNKEYQLALQEDKQREGKNWFHLYKKHGHWYVSVGLSSYIINVVRTASESAAYKLIMSIVRHFVEDDDFADISSFVGYFVAIIKSMNKTGHGEWWHIRLHPFHVISHGRQ